MVLFSTNSQLQIEVTSVLMLVNQLFSSVFLLFFSILREQRRDKNAYLVERSKRSPLHWKEELL